jgi:V8-like Glu-specific endopeptidase
MLTLMKSFLGHLLVTICVLKFVSAQDTGKQAEPTPQSVKSDSEILSKYSIEELKAELISRGNKTVYESNHPELEKVSSGVIIEKINVEEKGLYNPRGLDRRRDFWEIQDPTQLAVSNSVVALVSSTHYKEAQNGIHLTGPTLGQYKGLCSDQAYFDQPVIAYCTGFVVGSDLIATAGHCVGPDKDLNTIRIVFGYRRIRTHDKFKVETDIPQRDVFKILKVIARKQDANGADYAIVQVDRKIKNHLPLPLDTDGAVAPDDELYALGFPTGLPMKLADQAVVRSISSDGYFIANLDTFSGNSGSPVLKADSLTVVGILVRGGTDYTAKRDYCQVAFVCPEAHGCRGEDSTLMSAISDEAKEAIGVKPRRSPRTETFSSPDYPSGAGAASSPVYILSSTPTPAGYKIAHFEYSLSGDRICNQWSTCIAGIEGDRVVLRFTMQGHSEWMFPPRTGGPGLAPGQALSSGHLVVTYEPI